MTAEPVFESGALIAVLTTEPLGRTLDYRAPEGGCGLGDFVEVPLGPRRVLGVVWGAGQGDYDAAKIRAAYRRLDVPPMRAELRAFLMRAADYTLTPLPALLRAATRAPRLDSPPSARKTYALAGPVPNTLTEARFKVIEALRRFGGAPVTLGELADEAGVTTPVIKGLVKLGVLAEGEAPRDAPYPHLDGGGGARLEGDQVSAAADLVARVKSGQFSAVLLQGVTGSGKTEVYLEAVAACLARGKQALVLLPEISLTADFLARVQARFGARPAEWHSGVTQTERRRLWRMVGQGDAQMVVGARSALFLPFQDLGLIIVDEEHDTSYKQEEGVLYNARDMAVLRASIVGAPVVLASATPCLESWANAQAGKYTKLVLTARFGAAQLPQMSAIDMRSQALGRNEWISPTLAREVALRVAAGEQSLLFLNRRGYAPITLCRACGHQVECSDCDARMVEHRFLNQLQCHQCGAVRPVPVQCPACNTAGSMAAVGPGVERLAEEVAVKFPGARLAVLSSDLFASARALKEQIVTIADGGADIIIGTQIVAKGHNFPNLTLVGVIDADLGLHGSDLRAAERTFQLMRQVAGRAGRAQKAGIAMLQTFQPEHPVIHAILGGDEELFWAAEAAGRRAAGTPPYGRLAGVIVSSTDIGALMEFAADMARRDGPLRAVGAQLYGPAPAPVARVRGRHRARMLIKSDKSTPLQGAITAWLAQFKVPSHIRLAVDIDPQSFY
jgi:primosomal protein N' (replication factor Y) (superfamily II helicase)